MKIVANSIPYITNINQYSNTPLRNFFSFLVSTFTRLLHHPGLVNSPVCSPWVKS